MPASKSAVELYFTESYWRSLLFCDLAYQCKRKRRRVSGTTGSYSKRTSSRTQHCSSRNRVQPIKTTNTANSPTGHPTRARPPCRSSTNPSSTASSKGTRWACTRAIISTTRSCRHASTNSSNFSISNLRSWWKCSSRSRTSTYPRKRSLILSFRARPAICTSTSTTTAKSVSQRSTVTKRARRTTRPNTSKSARCCRKLPQLSFIRCRLKYIAEGTWEKMWASIFSTRSA